MDTAYACSQEACMLIHSTCRHVLLLLSHSKVCCVQELARLVQSRQAEGFRVVKYSSGVAHDNVDMHLSHANLHYLVLLQRQNQ